MGDQPATATGGQAGDYVTLAKPRLNLLVIATTLAGYYMASPRGAGWGLLLHTLVGTALVAGGSSVFNQIYEREVPAMFVPNVFSFATEGKCYRYGSVRMPIDMWGPWRVEEDPHPGSLPAGGRPGRKTRPSRF